MDPDKFIVQGAWTNDGTDMLLLSCPACGDFYNCEGASLGNLRQRVIDHIAAAHPSA